MARIMASNTDSGIESDPEEQSVLLVVDIGDSVITSRDDDIDCSVVVSDEMSSADVSHDSDLSSQPMDVSTTADDTRSDDTTTESSATTSTTDDDTQSSFRLCLSSGEVLTVSVETFSEYETQVLPEFFNGLAKGKSPESYLQIRNHFIQHWHHVRPKRFGYHEMLRKVGHLHLGNVTAFSRVQKFLESHKVINEGGVSKDDFQRIKRRLKSHKKDVSRQKKSFAENQMKKLRLDDNKTTPDDRGDADVKLSSRTRPNPFKLVPLETYDGQQQPPFAVRLSMEALAIIDIHAHCVRTEVIGLLGGRYCPKTRELKVLTSEPCASLDDHDLQCDMEPVSQALAKEALERRSFEVVGWYHSHPTFVPNPSLRDLETQLLFQRMFSNDSNGQPFIALILSPYCWPAPEGGRTALVSRFKCLYLSDQSSALNEYKIPFELSPKIIRTDKLFVAVAQKLSELCARLASHGSRVRMGDKVKRFRLHNQEVTHLEKLQLSLAHFLNETGLSQRETQRLLAIVAETVARHLAD